MNARAVYTRFGEVNITFPYTKTLVEDLKAAIPGTARSWDPDLKVWSVALGYDQIAIRLLQRYFPQCEVTTEAAYRRSQFTVVNGAPARDPDRDLLTVTNDAPIEVIRAAYLAWAKLEHPDCGGDTEKMRQINAAFDRLHSSGRSEGAA